MTGVFLDYSKYYDLLYRDKDYQSEVEFVVGLIRKFHPAARTILNLGCGTGNHDFIFAEAGFEVTGVDLSSEMIKIAQAKNSKKSCTFIQGDARAIPLTQRYDVVVSLFHVLSYQNTNKDVLQFLSSIEEKLKPDGIALFDYWYGPAVLSIKPEKRSKLLESSDLVVKRQAETEMDFLNNIATVNYEIEIEDKTNRSRSQLHEKHPMRYYFSPELELFYERVGFSQILHAEWMSESTQPSERSGGAYSVVKKLGNEN